MSFFFLKKKKKFLKVVPSVQGSCFCGVRVVIGSQPYPNFGEDYFLTWTCKTSLGQRALAIAPRSSIKFYLKGWLVSNAQGSCFCGVWESWLECSLTPNFGEGDTLTWTCKISLGQMALAIGKVWPLISKRIFTYKKLNCWNWCDEL